MAKPRIKESTVKTLRKLANAMNKTHITMQLILSRVLFIAIVLVAAAFVFRLIGLITWILAAIIILLLIKDLLPEPLTKLISILLTLFVIGTVVLYIVIPFFSVYTKSGQARRTGKFAKFSIFNLFHSFQNFVNKTTSSLYWSDQWYTSQVDDNKQQPLGVEIKSFTPLGIPKNGMLYSTTNFYEDQPIALSAVVTIKGLKNPINTRFSCFAKGPEETMDGETIPEEVNNVTWQSYLNIECFINNKPKPDFYTVTFSADFNAETWAYVNIKFMSMEEARRLGFKIKSTPITAETTNSPVKIGVFPNDMEGPFILSKEMADKVFTTIGAGLRSTLQGSLTSINEMLIWVPKPFELVIDNNKCSQKVTIKDSTDSFTVYKVESFKPGVLYQAVTCPLRMKPGSYEDFFKNKKTREVTFRFMASYGFQIQKSTTIEVLESVS